MIHIRQLLLLPLWASAGWTAAINPRWDTRSTTSLEACLSDAVGGEDARVQFRDEAGFNTTDVKPFNLNLQYLPVAVMYPQTTTETSAIVKCASLYGHKIQARSGGRDFINKCIGGDDNAIVIDMKYFNKVEVDNTTGIATVGPGQTLKALVNGLIDNGGRYIPHGSSPTVGVGGHLMVGGMGLTSRQNGMSIDVLQEIEVVLANGTVTRASEDENPDLFWVMRGAGASFGLATEFKFQTKPEPEEIVSFSYNFTSSNLTVLGEAVKAYHEIMRDPELSRRVGITSRFTAASYIMTGAFSGSEADFDALKLADRLPTMSTSTVLPGLSWSEFMNSLFNDAGKSNDAGYFYTNDMAVTHETIPSNSSIDSFINTLASAGEDAQGWSFLFDLFGGAMNDTPEDGTAFPHRNSIYFLTAYTRTTEKTPAAAIKLVDDAVLSLQDNKPENYLAYAGVPSLSHGDEAQQKYWGSNLARLETIKAALDPDDVFSTPQGVKPSSSS
ncbi:hypothetical protein B0J13DRAFT_665948 [Dactylonectria estremocensis]|uniref:FAD-binding PCMH-type domain-containing protein n=1 Tax=Dactylonectria estremocensis TaxID=1079267 RepID=A0A9P9EUK2_9HYPO|nr:hypothetical protein B0J13DRAFT_665948 [Dactylonectria estremocensis]